MKIGDRLPGARLSRRSSGRLARADRHLRGPHLIARLTRRAQAGPALLPGTLQRMERWQRSPMLAWARAVEHAGAAWGPLSPPLILAWPQPEGGEGLEPGFARAPRRSAPLRASAPSATPAGPTPALPWLGGRGGVPRPSPGARPVFDAPGPGPDGRPTRPLDPTLVGPITPRLRPGLPAAVSASGDPPHPSLARAQARQAASSRAVSPASSHWVSRLWAPAPALAPPSAAGSAPSGPRPAPPGSAPRFAPASPPAVLAQAHPDDSSTGAPGRAVGAAHPGQAYGHAQHQPERGRADSDPAHRLERPARARSAGVLRGLRERSFVPSDEELQVQARSAQAALRPAPTALPEPAPAARVARRFEHHPSRSLLTALARASSVEGVARIAVAHAPELARLEGLPAPLAEVVGALAQQAGEARPASRPAPVAPGSPGAAPSAPQQRAQQHIAQVLRSQADSPVVSLSSQRLLRRLQNLVHLAEVDRRRLEAQRKVRMAEDSAHARAQARSAPGSDAAGDAQPVDLDSLQREVFNVVNALRESRTVRRLEDPDVPHDAF